METVDQDGTVRDEAGAPVDRIEGGALARVQGDYRGVAPTTVLMGALVVVMLGLFLGWYLFHARTPFAKGSTATTAGTAATVPQRDAITADQAREALMGTPAGAAPGATGISTVPNPMAPGGQLPVGMTADQAQQPGTTPTGTAPGQRPVDPRVALDQASRRAPIMGFTGGLAGIGGAGRAQAPGAADGGPGIGNGLAGSPGQGEQPGAGAALKPAGPTAGEAQDGLSSQLAHHVIETARATLVPDRDFLLSAGTLVPCTLQTAINSTQAGYVSCVIGKDVYSEDGRVILLDKGTKVLGQYSGGIAQGQARLFVLWTRALTPRGVAIDLGSPAADDLGRAGMAGGVDTMFWQRFGGALMLSVLQDLGDIASSRFANRGTQTTQVPADTASVALQNSINIKPVLKKNQGDEVAIFVAKDFDFSSVYNLRVKP